MDMCPVPDVQLKLIIKTCNSTQLIQLKSYPHGEMIKAYLHLHALNSLASLDSFKTHSPKIRQSLLTTNKDLNICSLLISLHNLSV